jgi:hypothetical protein
MLMGDAFYVGIPFGLGTERTAAQFAERLNVDFGTKTLLPGCEKGELSNSNFASGIVGDENIETKVACLDTNAKSLILSFLDTKS